MNQNKAFSNTLSVKSSPKFDTIPEDVVLSIVKFIQGWAIEEGDEAQREKGRKARDSTLRAAALTSSRTFQTYFTSLLQHVTLNAIPLFSFCQMLEREEPRYGALVRSIRFERSANYSSEKHLKLLRALGESFSSLPATEGSSECFWEGLQVAMERCYRQLIILQSLVMLDPFLSFFKHFLHKIGGQLKPHSFLENSLKRLFIQFWNDSSSNVNPNLNTNLNAKNATWLLVFCRQIEEACLGFELSIDDSKYLSEFAETIDGLSSVKKLAIRVKFIYKEGEKKTWWGVPKEENGNHKGGSRKTESIINLLQTTNQLDALEIYAPLSNVRNGDSSKVSLDCLSALPKSFNSLKLLRLLGGIIQAESSSLWTSFRVLRVLTLDFAIVHSFSFLDLHRSIEILCLPYHLISQEDDEENFDEELVIGDMIDHPYGPIFGCLKEVVVPSRPIADDGKQIDVPHQMRVWAKKRNALKAADAFKGGNTKLRTVEVGEIVGEASKGEVLWSNLRWLSPP